MTEQKTRVIVIGGGYAGVIAANHLRVREDVRITLINPRDVVRRADPAAPVGHRLDDAVVDYETVLGAGSA